MTDEQVIDAAREAGFRVQRAAGLLPHVPEDVFAANVLVTEELKRFTAIVAAAERERCAVVCDAGMSKDSDWDTSAWNQACLNRAVAIRGLK